MRRIAAAAILAATPYLFAGCYFWVDRAPTGLERSRRRAEQKIGRIESKPRDERGKPHSLKLWIYDADGDRLYKASVPIWLVRKILNHVGETESDSNESLARYGIDLEDVLESGPGLLVSVDSDEEEVLAWLE